MFGTQKYIDKMIGNYTTMFGEKPKGYTSPLEANDHPELDDTDILMTMISRNTNPCLESYNGQFPLEDLTY
jgi:hypothetical protein